MGAAFLYGSGGASILNVTVLGGTTQPSNPKENTLWVNTDVEITDWDFNAAQPTTRTDGTALRGGEVWLKTATSAGIHFNALKKNGLMAYPMKVYQYSGTTWVAKDAQIYRDAAWERIVNYLYLNGEQFVPMQQYQGADTGSGSVTFGTSAITITRNGVVCEYAGPSDKIDLTDFTTLTALFASVEGGGTSAQKGLLIVGADPNAITTRRKPTTLTEFEVFGGDSISDKMLTVDITALTGEQYIYAGLSSGWAGTTECTLSELVLS